MSEDYPDLKKALRTEAGLKLREAAELLGRDAATVTRAVAGRSPTARGPVELLVAIWPELSGAAQERVRLRLQELRAAYRTGSDAPTNLGQVEQGGDE